MAVLYFYLDHNEEQQGPFNATQMREFIAAGLIKPTTHVRTDSLDRWVYAHNIKGAFPDYAPTQPSKPAARRRRRGFRAARHIARNLGALLGVVMLAGVGLQAYRSLAVPWLFPPVKAPPPPVVSLVEEQPSTIATAPSNESRHVNTNGADDSSSNHLESTEDVRSAPAPSLETRSTAPSGGNSLSRQLHRGLMGEQYCIKPKTIVQMPDGLPLGEFFYNDVHSNYIYSPHGRNVNLNDRGVWPLPSVAFAPERKFQKIHALCRIGGYSQASPSLSRNVGIINGLLTYGSLRDWKDVSDADTRLNFELNTGLRIVRRDIGLFPTIAISDGPTGQRIAVCDIWNQIPSNEPDPSVPPHVGQPMAVYNAPEGQSVTQNRPELHSVRRLRVLSLPTGRVLAESIGALRLGDMRDCPESEKGRLYSQWIPHHYLVFSPNGNHLAAADSEGKIEIYETEHLRRLREVPSVRHAGPFLTSGEIGDEADFRTSTRMEFDASGSMLLAIDRGQVVLVDIRTEEVRRVGLRAPVNACCFNGQSIMAASVSTGEVYRISLDTGRVTEKALLAGLGPLTTDLNFSQDGNSLSAIFCDTMYTDGSPKVHWGLFWNLRLMHQPTDKMENLAVWSCRPEYRAEYPGSLGSFVGVGLAPGGVGYVVNISDADSNEVRSYPLRCLTEESQKQAILLHSLVEPPDQQELHFDPDSSLFSYHVPGLVDIDFTQGPGWVDRPTSDPLGGTRAASPQEARGINKVLDDWQELMERRGRNMPDDIFDGLRGLEEIIESEGNQVTDDSL